MRRRLANAMPELSALFGLKPWHFGGDESLTYAEADSYLAALNRHRNHQQQQSRGR